MVRAGRQTSAYGLSQEGPVGVVGYGKTANQWVSYMFVH